MQKVQHAGMFINVYICIAMAFHKALSSQAKILTKPRGSRLKKMANPLGLDKILARADKA